MNFGRLTPKEVKIVDFTLPQDGEQTIITLNGLKRRANLGFYVGCAKWGRKEWKGLIYPEKTKVADFLGAYARQFNSIELNAVFYKIPQEEQILKWREMVEENSNANFIFCPKISRTITHIKRLRETDFLTDEYIKSISLFDKHLGPCFLRLAITLDQKTLMF